MSVKAVQSSNISDSAVGGVAASTLTDVRPLQSPKARLAILVTLLGIVMAVSPEQP